MKDVNFPCASINFHNIDEKDIAINTFGFDDFNVVKPLFTTRVQEIYTLHLVLNGCGTLILDGKEYAVSEHDMFFISPNIPFAYYPNENNKWRYIWFSFTGNAAELYKNKMGFTNQCPIRKCPDFQNCYYNIYNLLHAHTVGLSVGYYAVLSLFYKVVDICSDTKSVSNVNTIESIMSYISYHYQDTNLTIKKISDDLGVSHSHLCRLTKAEANTTISTMLISFRINKAAYLLEQTSLSVKEISFSVGFGDYPHFIKTFKRLRGSSPTEYRNKQHKKEIL